jgi:hypothetical protein
MGYWEQIGEKNKEHAEWQRSGGWWRRVDWLGIIAVPIGLVFLLSLLWCLWVVGLRILARLL